MGLMGLKPEAMRALKISMRLTTPVPLSSAPGALPDLCIFFFSGQSDVREMKHV